MNILMNTAGKVVAAVCGLLAAISLAGAVGARSWDMLPPAVLFSFLSWYFWGRRRDSARTGADHARLVGEAAEFIAAVNAAGAFPPARADRVLSPKDEPILAACNARLVEASSEQVRSYIGTRIKVGKLPFYIGQSTPHFHRVIRETAVGELAVTPRSLVFSCPDKSVDFPLSKVIGVDIALDSFSVAVRGRQAPYLFAVSNGLLWGVLVKNLTQIGVSGRALPAGAKLTIQ